ncbi:hypothetical protein FPQ18DRAFT_420557 [Pyronema domesticum]|nr:hypothetical protein FPQ18DRAFT_420557 [Pyronema domesticum]
MSFTFTEEHPGKEDTTYEKHITYKTQAPFPEIFTTNDETEETDELLPVSYGERPHESTKVRLNICSEFMEYSAPLQYFKISSDATSDSVAPFRLIHDAGGQHLVFTIASDNAFDVTPTGIAAKEKIVAFDVFQPKRAEFNKENNTDSASTVHLVAATKSTIYHATIAVAAITLDVATGNLTGFYPAKLPWKAIQNNLGAKSISTLSCGISNGCNSAGYKIFVGTERAKDAAWHYIVDPSEERKHNPWAELTMAEAGKKVLATQPGALGFEDAELALFTLFESTGAGGCQCDWCKEHRNEARERAFGCSVDGIDPKSDGIKKVYIRTLLCPFGTVRNIYSSLNPGSTTDILVAGDGIGFINAEHPDIYQEQCHVLKGIDFSQVVGREKALSEYETMMTIFALSTDGELYYVEGSRTLNTEGTEMVMNFHTVSAIPIRSEVAQISAQFNASNNASELLYSSTTGNEIKHLMRDPTTSMWSETALTVRSLSMAQEPNHEDPKIKYPAFITKIRLCGEDDLETVPEGYPVKITSDMPCLVTANGRALSLGKRPKEVLANSMGEITIISRVHGLLGAPTYKLSLFKYLDEPKPKPEYSLQPAQRIIRLLGSIKSADDIKNAKDTTGKPVFDDTQKRDYEAAAAMLKDFPDMMDGVSSTSTTTTEPFDETLEDPILVTTFDKDGGSKTEASTVEDSCLPKWLDDAITVTGNFLGDVVEFLEKAFKAVLRFAIRVCGPVIKLYLWIQDKVIELVLGTAISVLRTIGSFLKRTLGINFSFLGWLGLLLDIEEAKKTQHALKVILNDSFRTARTAMPILGKKIHKSVDDTKASLSKALGIPIEKPKKSGFKLPAWVSKLFNNPILDAIFKFNPLGWALDVIMEELEGLGLDIQVPDPSILISNLTATVAKWVATNGATLFDMFVQFLAYAPQFIGNISDPGKCLDVFKDMVGTILGAMFEALETLVDTIFSALEGFLGDIQGLLNFEWKFPLLTKAWEIFADQKFSIMNAITLITAQLFNTVAQIFGLGNPATMLNEAGEVLKEIADDLQKNKDRMDKDSEKETKNEAEKESEKEGVPESNKAEAGASAENKRKLDDLFVDSEPVVFHSLGVGAEHRTQSASFLQPMMAASMLPGQAVYSKRAKGSGSHPEESRRLLSEADSKPTETEEEKKKKETRKTVVRWFGVAANVLRVLSTLINVVLSVKRLKREATMKRVEPYTVQVEMQPGLSYPHDIKVEVLDADVVEEIKTRRKTSREKGLEGATTLRGDNPEGLRLTKGDATEPKRGRTMKSSNMFKTKKETSGKKKEELSLWERMFKATGYGIWALQVVCDIVQFVVQTLNLHKFDRYTVIPFLINIVTNLINLVLKIKDYEEAPGLDEIINRIGELAASLVRINLPEKGSDAELNTYETIIEGFYISSAIGGLVQGGLEISRKRIPKLLAAGVILDFGGVLGAFVTAIIQQSS